MSVDKTKGAKAALDGYYKRLLKPKSTSPTRRNAKPEKEVERACMAWMHNMGWSMQVYESKAKCINGVWRSAGMKYGTCDAQGNTDQGIAAYVEFKAFGKLATFNRPANFRQRNYILDKINARAFACVVDSDCLLEKIYREWSRLRTVNFDLGVSYLAKALP